MRLRRGSEWLTVGEQNEDDAAKPDGGGAAQSAPQDDPPWAEGLRHLYQQVVEEPLPDALAQLLARLDGEGE